MASTQRRPTPDLRGSLHRGHTGFDFYQLVRLLVRLSQAQPANGEASHGETSEGIDQAVRFRGELSAAFPGHEVSRWREGNVRDGETSGPVEIATPNYSIAGAMGPLPDPFVEWARDRAARGDRAMADFLDIFNHRINALRFELKSRQRPGLSTGDDPEHTPLARDLAAILGSCDPDLPNPLPLPRRALLALAGLLADRRHSPSAVVRVLRAFTQADVKLAPFVGSWFPIAEEDQTRLGSQRHRLGVDTALGARAWDEHAGIGLTIGPLPRARFEALLPGNEGYAGFKALLHFLTGRSVDCHVRLLTERWNGKLRHGRGLRLGMPGGLGQDTALNGVDGVRLGYAAWLGEGEEESYGEASFVIPAFDGEVAA